MKDQLYFRVFTTNRSIWGRKINMEFKQIATAGSDTAAGSKFPQKCDTAHVRRLHQAVAPNPFSSPEPPFLLVTWSAKLVNDILRRVALGTRMRQIWLRESGCLAVLATTLASLALGHLGILRILLDAISFKVNSSQRLCQGCLSQACKSAS